MAADACVELYHGGIVSLEEFAGMPHDRDILVRILVPKTKGHISCQRRRDIWFTSHSGTHRRIFRC